MRRASAISGLFLAVLLGYRGLTWGQVVPLLACAIGAVALGWSAWETLRMSRRGQVILCTLALLALAEALPAYFRTYRVWPMLPAIFFAAMSLGLGILGYVLDRYPGERPSGPSL